jgi:hypothetical protein
MNRWNIFNGVLFQLTWFACVLGGAADTAVWGVAALVLLLGHSGFAGTMSRDLILASAAAAVGFVVETFWIQAGVLNYGGAMVAPVWIVMLWGAVGLSLNHCLSMFKPRPWLGGLLAGLGAPLSYLSGERLGAVGIGDPLQLVWISVVWLLLFALAFKVAGVLTAAMDTSAIPHVAAPKENRYERAH